MPSHMSSQCNAKSDCHAQSGGSLMCSSAVTSAEVTLTLLLHGVSEGGVLPLPHICQGTGACGRLTVQTQGLSHQLGPFHPAPWHRRLHCQDKTHTALHTDSSKCIYSASMQHIRLRLHHTYQVSLLREPQRGKQCIYTHCPLTKATAVIKTLIKC